MWATPLILRHWRGRLHSHTLLPSTPVRALGQFGILENFEFFSEFLFFLIYFAFFLTFLFIFYRSLKELKFSFDCNFFEISFAFTRFRSLFRRFFSSVDFRWGLSLSFAAASPFFFALTPSPFRLSVGLRIGALLSVVFVWGFLGGFVCGWLPSFESLFWCGFSSLGLFSWLLLHHCALELFALLSCHLGWLISSICHFLLLDLVSVSVLC